MVKTPTTPSQHRPASRGLLSLSLQRAEAALAGGDLAEAQRWIETVPVSERPRGLVAAVAYGQAKLALNRQDWRGAEERLVEACHAANVALYQRRLHLLRSRSPLLDDAKWNALRPGVDAVRRLGEDALRPVLESVRSCGAYHPYAGRQNPWSRLLRLAKGVPGEDGDRDAALNLAAGFFCRYLVCETPLPRCIDLVVAVPPDSQRYVNRGLNVPSHLASAVEKCLAVPFEEDALRKTKEIELRGLSWGDRERAVQGAFELGRGLQFACGRVALLVDDVATSGATLRECGRLLLAAGAKAVHGLTLCHAEN